MRLYLVRHGDAVSEQQNRERPLSPQGLADVRKLAKFLKPLGLTVRGVWHSGLARAVETAGVLANTVKSEQGMKEIAGLTPDDPIGPIRKRLESATADIMIVGHQPFLGALAAKLLTGSKSASLFDIDKSTVLCLERKDSEWKMIWMLTPELLG